MAIEQSIFLTIMPRSISINTDGLPVSVFISPRLSGANNLGSFADWLEWTRKLYENGMELEFRSETRTLKFPINTKPLRPELWEQLFKSDTLVRSFTFDDYSDRGIISYSVREALSALKAIYQEAGITLALPDPPQRTQKHEGPSNRERLRSLMEGLQVHWSSQMASRWREAVRVKQKAGRSRYVRRELIGPLDYEGLSVNRPDSNDLQKIAVPFAVFHHMPTPSYSEHPLDNIDTQNLFDFHQALSALNAYPELLRALGLVFDFELPRGFMPTTPLDNYGIISIGKVNAGWDWAITPKVPKLETAYLHVQLSEKRVFLTAPRVMVDHEAPVTAIGLLNLDSTNFGLAQVDVDGGMHKNIMLAESMRPPIGHNRDPDAKIEPAPHPEVFDAHATLPSLRSGGLSLYSDQRTIHLLDTLVQSKAFNDAITSGGTQPRPFFAEDLIRGYRLDIWDSRTNAWHSLHLRNAKYFVGELEFIRETNVEEGFVQLAMTQPARDSIPVTNDLYLHEALARWSGWSLSAPMPAKHLSRYANATDAVPRDEDPEMFSEDEPVTPFNVRSNYQVYPNSLPRLRFGVRYRIRARVVDLAGNSLKVNDDLANEISSAYALPHNPEGFTYLRYEPVAAPLLVIRDSKAITEPGSDIDRMVIRTFNDDISKDTIPAQIIGADRHILPPRTSVEMAERLGMFDDVSGNLKSDPATWKLIVERDAAELNKLEIVVKGKTDKYPVEPDELINPLPFLPDPLSRGAAIRDLPGTPTYSIGRAEQDSGPSQTVTYHALSDPNPRNGSVTLISFGNVDNWKKTLGFLFRLTEPESDQTDMRPEWDPIKRLLKVYLPKGHISVVPLSSFTNTEDLKLMGIWQWLRDYVDRITVTDPQPQFLQPGSEKDKIAHVLQRAIEGGHWMLTPPRLLTLVHAVQQPIGLPEFLPLNVEHEDSDLDTDGLQTAQSRGRSDPTEMAPITAYRRLGATDAYLHGALKLHGASTIKIHLSAEWEDPEDNMAKPSVVHQSSPVDELPLTDLNEDYLRILARDSGGEDYRYVGYYDPEHDQIAFVRAGDWTRRNNSSSFQFIGAAPRHILNDTKRHIVKYTAMATSRFKEYFPENQEGGFTRSSNQVIVDIPASARPLAPEIVCVIPTFGWERQTETNLKRSVRFGGGLRVYMRRPWFSSGEGELLGVTLWSYTNGSLNDNYRDKFKPFFTQWGMDPIWQTGNLSGAPGIFNFPDAVDKDRDVSLDESVARLSDGQPGRVHVVGFRPEFDESRGLWFADLTINTYSQTYMPFVRLALVRYQPHALADARVSRVVLADFAQLTPDRSAIVTSDPHHSRTLRVVISGVSPRGPLAKVVGKDAADALSSPPTQIRVRVQQRDPAVKSDLSWHDVLPGEVQVIPEHDGHVATQPELVMWAGSIIFTKPPSAGQFRLIIEEEEYISAEHAIIDDNIIKQPSRLIYAEVFEIDSALVRDTL
jgi:hypothetical protein